MVRVGGLLIFSKCLWILFSLGWVTRLSSASARREDIPRRRWRSKKQARGGNSLLFFLTVPNIISYDRKKQAKSKIKSKRGTTYLFIDGF